MKLKGDAFVPGYAAGHISADPSQWTEPSRTIVLLEEPSIDTMLGLSLSCPAGAVVVGGERFSHLVIYLCSLGIPTVLIADQEGRALKESTFVLLNGHTGVVIVNPDTETRLAWEEKMARAAYTRPPLLPKELGPARTKDEVAVTVGASISSAQNASDARHYGADEVGLLRSEFLFIPSSNPADLNTHLATLREVCEAAAPLPVSIRLFDVGGEKRFKWVPAVNGSDKTLGIRGARFYEYDEFASLLHCQLEAISRLSVGYEVSVTIPFISSPEEFVALREEIENVTGRANLRIGAMIETPSICLSLSEIADVADYVDLGTNDLMQCFFAADRGLNATAKYLEPYSPALFRFLQMVVSSANDYNIPIQVCGQLPLYPYITPLLVGLGFRRFSVEPYMISILKQTIRGLDSAQVKEVATTALACRGVQCFKTFVAESMRRVQPKTPN